LSVGELGNLNRVCKQVRPVSDDPFLWRVLVQKFFPFCNGDDFKNNWKNCFKVHSKLKIGWDRGRSKDFKMTPLRGHKDYISCFDFYRQHVVSGSNDNKIILWKVNNTKPIHTLTEHEGLISAIKFNELFIASGSFDQTAKIWDCTTGVCITTILHDGNVTSLGFDDNSVYTSSTDHIGRICDLRTGAVNNRLVGHNHPLQYILPGNPGQFITSSNSEIKVWDTRNDSIFRAYAPVGNINCICYAGNDRLVAGLANGQLIVYNNRTGAQEYIGQLHNSSINCLHTDGRSVVTGSNDQTCKLMDLETKVVLHHLVEHEGPVHSVQMDDAKIVSGGGDMCMKVWNRRTGARLYSLLGGSLQRREGNNPPHPQKQGCSQLMFDPCRVIGSFNSLLRAYCFLLTE